MKSTKHVSKNLLLWKIVLTNLRKTCKSQRVTSAHLSETRDRLTAERDEQASRLDALESAQERSERDLDELQEALSSATR